MSTLAMADFLLRQPLSFCCRRRLKATAGGRGAACGAVADAAPEKTPAGAVASGGGANARGRHQPGVSDRPRLHRRCSARGRLRPRSRRAGDAVHRAGTRPGHPWHVPPAKADQICRRGTRNKGRARWRILARPGRVLFLIARVPFPPCYCGIQLQLWFPNFEYPRPVLPWSAYVFPVLFPDGLIIAATPGLHSVVPGTASPKEN